MCCTGPKIDSNDGGSHFGSFEGRGFLEVPPDVLWPLLSWGLWKVQTPPLVRHRGGAWCLMAWRIATPNLGGSFLRVFFFVVSNGSHKEQHFGPMCGWLQDPRYSICSIWDWWLIPIFLGFHPSLQHFVFIHRYLDVPTQ